MDRKSLLSDLNKKIVFSPLKNMDGIVPQFEQSAVSHNPVIFSNVVEGKNDDENGIENRVLKESCKVQKNGSKNDEDLDLLFENDISDIDFDISKDMFADIKLKEEEVSRYVGNVSVQLQNGEKNKNYTLRDHDGNLNEEKVTSLDLSANSANANHIEMILDGSLEIPFDKSENNKCLSSIKEVQRIMTELQETSLIKEIDKDSNGNLDKKDVNASANIIDPAKTNITSNGILKTSANNHNTNFILDKTDVKSQEKISASVTNSPESINYNDSIQAVIESVIQNSAQQDLDSSDSSNEKELNGKQPEKKAYGVFEVVVPLIGKNVMKLGNDVPFTRRYDLAKKRNEMRGKFHKNDPNFPIPKMSYEEWRRIRESRTKEEIAAEEKKKVINAVQLAKTFTKIAIRILLEYEKDEPNQAAMARFFRYFEVAPASPLSLLYAPHFVHTMMLCRGDEDLSPNLRRAANECYDKCHALFPIPEGYNFETVYTSEVKKYVPDELDKLSDLLLDYGDYDSSDFEDDISDGSNESDKDWE